ncbi:hypothetical protein DFAR_750014 [Desulfarculales bacterium]
MPLAFKAKVNQALTATDACLKDLMAVNQDLFTVQPNKPGPGKMPADQTQKIRVAVQVLRLHSTTICGTDEAMCCPMVKKTPAKTDFQARVHEFEKLAKQLPQGALAAPIYQKILEAKAFMATAGLSLVPAAAHGTLGATEL